MPPVQRFLCQNLQSDLLNCEYILVAFYTRDIQRRGARLRTRRQLTSVRAESLPVALWKAIQASAPWLSNRRSALSGAHTRPARKASAKNAEQRRGLVEPIIFAPARAAGGGNRQGAWGDWCQSRPP
jgi:hypothetical protein